MDTHLTGLWDLISREHVDMLLKEAGAEKCPILDDQADHVKGAMEIMQTGTDVTLKCHKMGKTTIEAKLTMGKKWKVEGHPTKDITVMPNIEGKKLVLIMTPTTGKPVTCTMEAMGEEMRNILMCGSMTAKRIYKKSH